MPKVPKKKVKVSLTLDKFVWKSIDIHSKDKNQSKSEFVNEILDAVLGSSRSFIEYELLMYKKAYNVALLRAQNYNSEKDIKEIIEGLKAGR